MKTYRTRDDLRDRLVKAFSSHEEVYYAFVFGREAEDCADCYSDIDMVVCSNDLAKTKANYLSLLDSISPIRATFCLEGTPQSYSEMIMLQDYSPYQKIDLTIADESRIGWVAPGYPTLVVYEDKYKLRKSTSKLDAVFNRQGVANKLTDVLFSVARFTKCLFRRDLDMYRRWESISNIALVLLFEKYFGWQPETLKAKLSSGEIRHLYAALAPEDKEQVERIRPPNGKLDLARSYQASVHLFIRLSRQKAACFGVALSEELIEYIKGFMDAEIERYQGLA